MARDDFIGSFKVKSKEWIEKSLKESNHPSAGVLEMDRVETDSAMPVHEIHGFKSEIESLKHFLLDQMVYNEFKSLVVVGEYGVGKTALCKTIFNDEDVKTSYAPRIWVSMPSTESTEGLDGKICVLKKILKRILEAEEEQINNQDTLEVDGEIAIENELVALLSLVNENLVSKKFLIVFDDVRREDSWNEKLMIYEDQLEIDEEQLGIHETQLMRHLSHGFPKGSGGRVIYTTRDEKLVELGADQIHEIHRLWPLSDHQSVWKIYKEALIVNGKEIPRNDQKCKEELINKTRGLPLAARLMGTLVPLFPDDEHAMHNGSRHETTEPSNHP
ncbi:unnamed protein product [Arabidopsis thaliana]|uniref:NB-ARC domain-containing protein n=1 Tax=Arabidopsis thaliana TaxID=3702 RepID=A0A654EKW8_ARATH|nr:unnamed protein product [Arabidopsis thaliana]